MDYDFSFFLVVATFATGIISGLYWLAIERVRGRVPVDQLPVIVEYARSFFPVVFIVLVLRSFLFEPFRIPSGSMIPTLPNRQRTQNAAALLAYNNVLREMCTQEGVTYVDLYNGMLADAGKDVRTEASMIKVWGTEMATEVIDNAMQAFGAMGVAKELPLQLMAQKVRTMRVYEGPSEVHRMVIARRILGGR